MKFAIRTSVVFVTMLAASLTANNSFADKLSADDARAIAVDAYLYFYPLVTMELTRQQSTNVEAGKEIGKGPMNTVVNVAAYPPGDYRGVVRPNFDTLYSPMWLDLANEPMVLSAPDTHGRYYLLPMLDMWSDVFASPGWRTTGTQAQTILIVYQGWKPDLRGDKLLGEYHLGKDVQVVIAPTPYVWIIGRTKTDGPSDYDAVHKIQAGLKLVPASSYGKTYTPPAVKIDSSVDMKTPPKTAVDHMTGQEYFTRSAELLKKNPPHMTDEPIIARMKQLGIVAGEKLNFDKLDPVAKKAIDGAPADAQKLMRWKVPTLARVVNAWSLNTDTMGVYGNYYLKRAIVAQLGLGANLPEDAIYPLNLADEGGHPLNGAGTYTIHFDNGATPPVNAFWSITLYDDDGFQVPNSLNRFAVSSWMPFKTNSDGSLDLYFQHESPGKEKDANWLPSPKGAFNLTMRLYAPKSDALTGKWNPPPVVNASGPEVGQAQ